MDINRGVDAGVLGNGACDMPDGGLPLPDSLLDQARASPSNAVFGDVLAGTEAEIRHVFFAADNEKLRSGGAIEPSAASDSVNGGLASFPDTLSDSAFAASMASFTADLHAELSRLASGPVASLYFEKPHSTSASATHTSPLDQTHVEETCSQCLGVLETTFLVADSATSATFCLCCRRPLLLPRTDYAQEEDTAFPRCTACMHAREPTKPVVEEEWWPLQYKHALLSAVEAQLWCKLSLVGNLPQSGESMRHHLYHQRNQVEDAQRIHEQRTLDAVRRGTRLANNNTEALFHEWLELQGRRNAENLRVIVLLSKCLQELGRGVPLEVGEVLQLYRGRDLSSEHQSAKIAATLAVPTDCGCCPAMLSIPAPSGVPLPNPCFCFCCARLVPESWMYVPEVAATPMSGDLCLDCAAAHHNLERKMFLVTASPTIVDWKRHKVAMGLERQLSRVHASAALAYKSGCESNKDTARWKVADGAAKQWQSRTEKLLSDHRSVLRRGWTMIADSRQRYTDQVELEKNFVVAIPPLLKILANLLVRQRMTVTGDERPVLKRSDSMKAQRSDERDTKFRKF